MIITRLITVTLAGISSWKQSQPTASDICSKTTCQPLAKGHGLYLWMFSKFSSSVPCNLQWQPLIQSLRAPGPAWCPSFPGSTWEAAFAQKLHEPGKLGAKRTRTPLEAQRSAARTCHNPRKLKALYKTVEYLHTEAHSPVHSKSSPGSSWHLLWHTCEVNSCHTE